MSKKTKNDALWQIFLCSGAEHLEEELKKAGFPVTRSVPNYDKKRKFANSDVYSCITGIESFSNAGVCIIQSFTCSGEDSIHKFTTGDRLMEVLQVLDILERPRKVKKRGGEKSHAIIDKPSRIVLIALHLPCSKQDQVYLTGESNSCHTAIRSMFAAGVDRIAVIDPHVPTNLSWFKDYLSNKKITILSMYAGAKKRIQNKCRCKNLLFVNTPGKKRSSFGIDLEDVYKERVTTNKVIMKGKINPRLKGKRVLVTDDMVISGTTIKNLRRLLLNGGVKEVYGYITHALPYEHGKEENLRRLVDAFDEKIYVSNTIRSRTFQKEYPKLSISCVPLIRNFLRKENPKQKN